MTAAAPHLTELLTRTRCRLRIERMVEVNAVALACAIPLATSAYIAAELFQFAEGTWLWSSAGIALGTVGIATLYAGRHWPNYTDAARAADHEFATAELLSSAWSAREAEDVVAQALRHRAEEQAQTQAGKTLSFKGRKPLVVLALSFFASVVALQLVPVFVPDRLEPVLATAPGVALALSDDILAVADLLEERAEKLDDSYVQSLAETMREVAESSQDDTKTSQAISEELAELRDYAYAAMENWEQSDAVPVSEIFDELVERSQVASGKTTGENLQSQGGFAIADTSSQSASLRAKIETLRQAENTPQTMAQGEEIEADAAYDYDQIPVDALAADSDEQASPSSTTGAPAAPSDDATGGASAMAGDGTGELEGMGQETAALIFEDLPELTLETIDTGEGQRIEEFLLPPTQDVIRIDAANQSLGAHWSPQEEAEVSRRAVGAQDQAVASRYRLMLRDGVTP